MNNTETVVDIVILSCGRIPDTCRKIKDRFKATSQTSDMIFVQKMGYGLMPHTKAAQ